MKKIDELLSEENYYAMLEKKKYYDEHPIEGFKAYCERENSDEVRYVVRGELSHEEMVERYGENYKNSDVTENEIQEYLNNQEYYDNNLEALKKLFGDFLVEYYDNDPQKLKKLIIGDNSDYEDELDPELLEYFREVEKEDILK